MNLEKPKKPIGYAISLDGEVVALCRDLNETMETLVEKIDEGYECVGVERLDSLWSYLDRYASFENYSDEWVAEVITRQATLLQKTASKKEFTITRE